jgi:hypothetical protein
VNKLTERLDERDTAAQAMASAAQTMAEKQVTQRELFKWGLGIVVAVVIPVVAAIIASR